MKKGKFFIYRYKRRHKCCGCREDLDMAKGVIIVAQTAIVTGASSGIGWEISKVLCAMGYEVFGIGRNFLKTNDKDSKKSSIDNEIEFADKLTEHFHPLVCDLLNTQELVRLVKKLRSKQKISVLVNNAGIGYYGLHEEIAIQNLQTMLRTNLEVPIILTNLLLRELKRERGYIINISSVTAQQSSPHGCAYAASKAGLSSFSKSLFDEARKYGVKVVTIQPDMTKTDLYRNADFCEGKEESSYLLPQEIAAMIQYVLSQREGFVVTELSVKPQLHRIQKK